MSEPDAAAPLHDRLRGRAPARGRQGAGARRAPRRAATARARSRSCSRRCWPAATRSGAGIVHRLDRDTSGLMVVARSEEAHRRLQAALAARRIEREYLALVEGRPPARTGTIDAPIGRDPRVRTRMAVGGAGRARGAHPLHARAARCRRPRCCACAWRRAARTRSACTCRRSAIPSRGDPEYGTPGLLGLERQFLHADAPGLRAPDRPASARGPLAAARRPAGGAGARAQPASRRSDILRSFRPLDPCEHGSRPCPERRQSPHRVRAVRDGINNTTQTRE